MTSLFKGNSNIKITVAQIVKYFFSFKLNTWMEDLHENHIHALAFQPLENVDYLKLVTVGGDKKFNVLHLTETETANSKWEWFNLIKS